MTAAACTLTYGSKTIPYRLVRRERRTLQISVLPNMSVEVVAPKSADAFAIQQRVSERAPWIVRQIEYFRQFHPRTPKRRYVGGETHLYLGRRYRLRIIKCSITSVKMVGGYIEIATPHPANRKSNRSLLEAWYHERARKQFHERLDVCLSRFEGSGKFRPHALIVRLLQQRWGSMSTAGRLVLNRALVQASVPEIDYVITHELCHRAHHNHGRKFFDLLDRVMPDWEKRKRSLERRLA
jgi:predicted metal-dependent hydrolase